MKFSSYDPFSRMGRYLARRLALDEFQEKRLAKLWWMLLVIVTAFGVRYWRHGDYLLTAIIAVGMSLAYWRVCRIGIFRCCDCRHTKSPEDLAVIIKGYPDGPDPFARTPISRPKWLRLQLRQWIVVAIFAGAIAAVIGRGPLAADAVLFLGFAALGAVELWVGRTVVDSDSLKRCHSCAADRALLDEKIRKLHSAAESVCELAKLRSGRGYLEEHDYEQHL